MATQTVPYITPEQYLEAERKAEFKSEYCDGIVFAMAGASLRHGVIVTNLSRELSSALMGRPCQVFTNDARVNVTSRLYAYPDVIVLCGKPAYVDSMPDTIVNPQVIIEVLSPSTEAYDRGAKFGLYRSLPSLREYLMVSQQTQLIEQYVRGVHGQWVFQATEGPGSCLKLPSLNVDIAFDNIYYNVEFVGA